MKASVRSAIFAAAMACTVWENSASAAIVFANSGSENIQTYSFKAASTGDHVAYFAGSGAALENQVGLLVNGVSTGLSGLNNHTSAIGQSFNFGHVEAGDVLTFVDYVTGNASWYSDPTLNGGNGNHIYSTTAAAGQAFAGSPAGSTWHSRIRLSHIATSTTSIIRLCLRSQQYLSRPHGR